MSLDITLDVFESSAEGCVTHSYACACREARMREIWKAANCITLLVTESFMLVQTVQALESCIGDEMKRLRAALDAWKPVGGELIGLLEQQARVDVGDRGRLLDEVAEELGT